MPRASGSRSLEAAIALSPGDHLGPYEIVGPLGSGGMGDVYRARDTRLRRDVALKVIRPSVAGPAYIERLAREARAAAALNHPNILAVFDVNNEGTQPYVVSELLEGESLRQRLNRRPVPYRKALEIGIHIAQALGAAHEKGIWHRDVKPGNVFLTSDGRVKLLDFGLAKLQPTEPASGPDDPEDLTASDLSDSGMVIGTDGYMAPEQLLTSPIDHRVDIFALGAVLYEMLTNRRAFPQSSREEIRKAVLKDDPVDPLEINSAIGSAAAAIVRRCLEKNREERFQSARDLAFHLRQLEQAIPVPPRPPLPVFLRRLLALLAIGGAVAGLVVLALYLVAKPPPTFRQVTFHRGRIGGARFAAQNVVYSQARAGGPLEVWLTLSDGPEARSLGFREADVLATRTSGELALCLGRRFARGERRLGTLARASLSGDTPLKVLDDVEDADWDPSGVDFTVARSSGNGLTSRLDYPIGHILYEAPGCFRSPRISRDGQSVAFLEDPAGLGVGGRIRIVTRDGASKVLTDLWPTARGLSWSPGGDEIWYTAAASGEDANRALHAVDLQGHDRLVLTSPASLTIWDAAPDGRVLLTRDDRSEFIVGVAPGATTERDFSWFDTNTTGLAGLSRDGQSLLLGDGFGVYLRPSNGDPPQRLGKEGAWADDLSPDKSRVLVTSRSLDRLTVIPTGPGTPWRVPPYDIKAYRGAMWFADGRRILFNGLTAESKVRAYVMEIPDGKPRPLTAEGYYVRCLSPDGKWAAGLADGEAVSLWPIDDRLVGPSVPQPLRGSRPGDRPVSWTSDGGSLWIFRHNEIPASIERLEIATGHRRLWKKLAPPDATHSIGELYITPSGDSYVYSFERILSQLYVARGLH